MKVLLTGSKGQLGQAIRTSKPSFLGSEKVELLSMPKEEFDLYNLEKCRFLINKIKPEWIINAGAYTEVDAAEENIDLAMRINAKAPKAIAEALLNTGGRLIQISTDFVFEGNTCMPIKTNEKRNPINEYGKSKAMGEEYLEQLLFPTGQCKVIRTSWLMSDIGKNFALTMVRLHKELDSFGVVSDQIGRPTTTYSLSKACWKLLEQEILGIRLPNILHWSDAGAASWYDIAIAVGEIGEELGIIKNKALIKPISTADYPTKANRPSYSILDCFNTREKLRLEPNHWRVSLKEALQYLTKGK